MAAFRLNAPIPSLWHKPHVRTPTTKDIPPPTHTHTESHVSQETASLPSLCVSVSPQHSVLRCLVPRCVWDGRAISAGTHTGENIQPSSHPSST
mmetsp:Transcript_36672/g.91884  ORF Transcript_36672/g.91884 Transcript_36672/m.91884 type:complete len:94 (+) Transcript_36672:443-724(+)